MALDSTIARQVQDWLRSGSRSVWSLGLQLSSWWHNEPSECEQFIRDMVAAGHIEYKPGTGNEWVRIKLPVELSGH